jgi:conjugal transfer/entry exclusion protein
MDRLQTELDNVKKQVKEDFQFSMIAMGRVTEHMHEVTRQLTEHMGEVTRELGHVQGKMARQEERFELMIDIVQNMMNETRSQQKSEWEEVNGKLRQVFQRLDRLEQGSSAA